jgi:hypothetical protein
VKCRRCKKPRASNSWNLTACSDGRKERTFYLCNKHDAELNGIVLAFFSVAGWEKKMAAYREKLGLKESKP